MALYRAGGGDNNPFKVFKGKTYITTGLSVTQSRVTILDGGYCVEDGICYFKIKLRANINLGKVYALTGLPRPQSVDPIYYGVLLSSDELENVRTMDSDKFGGGGYIFRDGGGANALSISYMASGDERWVYGIYPIYSA